MSHPFDGQASRRGTLLRSMAQRAAEHPQMEQAIMGAIRQVLPSVLEQVIAQEIDRTGDGVMRLYPRRVPDAERRLRDERLVALMRSGIPPDLAAQRVGCSRSHAYSVRRAMDRQPQASNAQP